MKVLLTLPITKENLLAEKKRLIRILDSIAIASNGNARRETCDDLANSLYFLIIIKLINDLDRKLATTEMHRVAIKIVKDHEKLFYEALNALYQQLISVDPAATFFATLSSALTTLGDYKDGEKHFPNKIVEYEKQLVNNAEIKKHITENDNIIATLPTGNEKTIFIKRNDIYKNIAEEYCAFKKLYSDTDINNIFTGLCILNKEVNDFKVALNMRSLVDGLLGIPDDDDIPQGAVINLKKYLPFEYRFNNNLSKFDVSAYGKNYSFEINRYNNSNRQNPHVITVNECADENKLGQFIALRVLAVLLGEIYNDDYKELLNLTFEDFCNPDLPYNNLNYQEIHSIAIHFFKMKDFLVQAKLYIDNHPESIGIKASYVRLLKFVKLNNFIYSVLRQDDHLNTYNNYDYLSNFVKELEIDNHGLQRTSFASYPKFKVTAPREVSSTTSNLVKPPANSI